MPLTTFGLGLGLLNVHDINIPKFVDDHGNSVYTSCDELSPNIKQMDEKGKNILLGWFTRRYAPIEDKIEILSPHASFATIKCLLAFTSSQNIFF